MKLFLDSANFEEIREVASWGVLDGVTTNPSLCSKESVSFEDNLKAICALTPGPVSAECVSLKADEIVAEGRALARLAPNIAVKIPVGLEGLKATKVLHAEGVAVNMTLVFSSGQALLAAKAGARFVARGGRRVPGDAGQLQGDGVGQDGVKVDPADADGVVGRDGVDPFPPGELGGAEPLLVPVAVEDPAPGAELAGLGRDAVDELLAAPGLVELDALQGEAAGQEVGVAVDEAGQDQPAAEVDELGPGRRELAQLGVRPDGEDRPPADGHGLGPGPLRVAGPHFPVDQNEVDHVPLRSLPAAREEPDGQDDRRRAAETSHIRSS